MKLKKDVNLIDFLKEVQKCRCDVYLETEDEDKLNLKSVLSQYLFVVLAEQSDVWEHGSIRCAEEDEDLLGEYLEAE